MKTTIPEQRPDESNKAFARRLSDWISGDDVRTKTDLRDWTGSPPFHLDQVVAETRRTVPDDAHNLSGAASDPAPLPLREPVANAEKQEADHG